MCRKPHKGKDEEESEDETWQQPTMPLIVEYPAMERVRDRLLVKKLADEIDASLQKYRDLLRFI